MQNIGTLTRRELCVFFYSPIAYVVMAVFLAVTGIFFAKDNFLPGGEASLRVTFGNYLPVILVFVVPMLTMRLLSEEFRAGTIETLMTAPVSETDVVLGKFCGTLIFYLAMLVTTLLHVILVAVYGPLDLGLLACTYVGLILLGGLYISVGLFFSACTRNQVIAVLCSFVLLAIFTFLANYLAGDQEGTVRVVLQHLSIVAHFQDFARGLFDLNHLIFFVSTTGLFLFLTVKVLESRRWR
ncbi:MAG: ABC transporter permease subunit [Planctomycetes bacterium]|nr:ABC transporter permease subunit [Planctomycetota bacterium]